jgi:hypothetical protein
MNPKKGRRNILVPQIFSPEIVEDPDEREKTLLSGEHHAEGEGRHWMKL